MKAGQFSSRFSKAIELVDTGGESAKIGGIYALEQIAKEAPENYLGTVIEVLSAFVRNAEVIPYWGFDTWKVEIAPIDKKVNEWYETFKKKSTEKSAKYPDEINALKDFYNEWKENNYKIKPEIQIAMTVLGRIRTIDNKEHWVDLPRINLSEVKLAKAELREANLMEADLEGANLRGAFLGEADLQGAILREANLKRANLWDANLQLANLGEANLKRAYLREANLQRAYLREANLKRAYLREAYLQEADLQGAILQRANLWEADLQGAYLNEADLTGAKFISTEQLLSVKTLYKVKGLPPGWEKELRKNEKLFEDPVKK